MCVRVCVCVCACACVCVCCVLCVCVQLRSLGHKLQGYKNIYSPVTFECTKEFVLVTFHSDSVLTNSLNITIIYV